MAASKNEILGRLRDEGIEEKMVSRMERLLGVFNDNLPQFTIATKGQLQAAYNKLNPPKPGKMVRGLGNGTSTVFNRFVKIYKDSLYSDQQVAKETVAAQEAREAEKAAMRQELLDKVVDFDTLTNAMAALGTLKLASCSLGRLLDTYELAASAKGGGAKC